MSETRVTVANFFDITSAEVARDFLEERGLEVHLLDETSLTTDPTLTGLAIQGVRLQVANWDVDRAYVLLNRLRREQESDVDRTGFASAEVAAELAEDAREEAEDNREVNRLAMRALKTSIVGIMLLPIFPIQLYASYLLLDLIHHPERVGPRYRWRAVLALVINLTGLVLGPLLCCGVLLPSTVLPR